MGELDKPVVVYGAGGHGKVVLDALERSGRNVLGFVDDDSQSSTHCGYPVFASLEDDALGEEFEVIVAIGDSGDRERVTISVDERGHTLTTAIHSSAVIGREVELGAGVMVLAQAAINPGSRLGRGVIINTGATVDHDCSIGDFVHVGPGAGLAGGVRVGDRVLIGVGASVTPGVKIGCGAVVGAGAVVIRDVEAGITVAGSPARVLAFKTNGGRGGDR